MEKLVCSRRTDRNVEAGVLVVDFDHHVGGLRVGLPHAGNVWLAEGAERENREHPSEFRHDASVWISTLIRNHKGTNPAFSGMVPGVAMTGLSPRRLRSDNRNGNPVMIRPFLGVLAIACVAAAQPPAF